MSLVSWFLVFWPWIGAITCTLLAYKIQNMKFIVRWCCGLILLKTLQFVQNYSNEQLIKLLPPLFADSTQSEYWLIINVTFGMLYGHCAASMFGGSKYFQKHGIDSYTKAFISSLFPGQIRFNRLKKDQNIQYKVQKISKSMCLIIIGYTMSKIIQSEYFLSINDIENNLFVHLEIIGLLQSIIQTLVNIIPNAIYLVVSFFMDDIEYIEPYDFVYFSKSIRAFWKHWSRPVGETLRYMIYEPLGGRKNFWISVPILFGVNATLHYDFSQNLYGYKAIYVWNKAFLWMGLSMAFFMFTENMFLSKKK
eukprot:731888_1